MGRLPVVAELVRAQGGSDSHALWWALALGADLGGNATAIGASANMVVLGLTEWGGQAIAFWQLVRYGLIVTVALAVPYLGLRYVVRSSLTSALVRRNSSPTTVTTVTAASAPPPSRARWSHGTGTSTVTGGVSTKVRCASKYAGSLQAVAGSPACRCHLRRFRR